MARQVSVFVCAALWTAGAVAAAQAADLTVKASGFSHEKGTAIFYLWKDATGFPKDPEKASARQSVEIREKSASTQFKGLEPGTYAVSLAHDENGNGKLDTGFMGKPKEGYGTSNNPKNKFSAPSFDQCKITVAADGKTIDIQVIY
jgi:uncharacterized protein (DUF2141 family)